MMFSEEDVINIKKRINERQELKQQYQKKIERAQKDSEALQMLKEMLPGAKQEKEEEEKQLRKEIRKLEKLKKAYERGEFPDAQKLEEQLENQLSSQEDKLVSHIENLEGKQNLQDHLEYKISNFVKKENEIMEKIKAAKEHEKKFDKFVMRIPKIAPILLYMNDLEDTINTYKNQILDLSQTIKSTEIKIQKASDENSLTQSQLSRKQADLDAINDDIRINEYQRERLKTEYVNLNSEVEHINIERSSAETKLHIQLENYKAQDEKLSLKILKSRLESIDKVIDNFPEYSRIEMRNQQILINKKKQLAHEIQKKIDNILYEISYRQNQSTEVMDLCKTLEVQWKEHDVLEHSTNEKENKLYGLQDLLERRKNVSKEITSIARKIDVKSGMKHLECLYEIAFKENRKLDKINRKLNRDLEIYESENKQYLRELQELSLS